MFLVVVGVLAITTIIGFTIFSEWNDEVQSSDSFSEVAKNETQDLTTAYPAAFENIVIGIMLALIISSITTAILSRFNMAFGIITIFLMLGLLIFPMFLASTWQDFIEDPAITVEDQFPITNFIMNYYPLVYLGYVLIMGVAYIFGDKIT